MSRRQRTSWKRIASLSTASQKYFAFVDYPASIVPGIAKIYSVRYDLSYPKSYRDIEDFGKPGYGMKLFETEKTGWTIIQQGTLFQLKEEPGSDPSIHCITDIDYGSNNKPVVTSVPVNSDGFSTVPTEVREICLIEKVVGQMEVSEMKKQFTDAYISVNGQDPPKGLIEQIDASSRKAPHVVFIGE